MNDLIQTNKLPLMLRTTGYLITEAIALLMLIPEISLIVYASIPTERHPDFTIFGVVTIVLSKFLIEIAGFALWGSIIYLIEAHRWNKNMVKKVRIIGLLSPITGRIFTTTCIIFGLATHIDGVPTELSNLSATKINVGNMAFYTMLPMILATIGFCGVVVLCIIILAVTFTINSVCELREREKKANVKPEDRYIVNIADIPLRSENL